MQHILKVNIGSAYGDIHTVGHLSVYPYVNVAQALLAPNFFSGAACHFKALYKTFLALQTGTGRWDGLS